MLWSNFYRCNPNSYAIVVRMGTLLSTVGNHRSMLVSNCLFHMDGAAMLLSNGLSDCCHLITNSNWLSDRCHLKYQVITLYVPMKRQMLQLQLPMREWHQKDRCFPLERPHDRCQRSPQNQLHHPALPMSEQLFSITLVERKVFKMKTTPYTSQISN